MSQVLNVSKAKLLAEDYQVATGSAKKGDFIYLDPHYQPISSSANFTSYTDSGFSIGEQRCLGKWFRELDRRECHVLLSSSNSEEVRTVYAGYHISEVQALRAINCKGSRRKGHTELVMSNNHLPEI